MTGGAGIPGSGRGGAPGATAPDPARALVVWCPDWPVVAAGGGAPEPVAVVQANRVVACSAAARGEGVRRGLRRRDAQARCPHLHVISADPARDARVFEAVAAAVDALTPRLEVLRPGLCAFPTRGPARLAGGEPALAAQVAAAVAAALPVGAPRPGVGVADGVFAATLAARQGVVVPPGGSAAFLGPLPVAALHHAAELSEREAAELVELLRRLGLRRLGQVAALPPAQVAGRLGRVGVVARRLAAGMDGAPLELRPPAPDLAVAVELDPPADRLDTLAFAARTLAERLFARLGDAGLSCAGVVIEGESAGGALVSRRWRHEEAGRIGTRPGAVAERVRWQVEGWLHGSPEARLEGGIRVLRLVPEQLHPDQGRQLGFWGGTAAATERAARAAARVQALLGPEAVTVPERRGGRGPGERIALVPAGVAELGTRPPAEPPAPWPGRVPAPPPALVHPSPPPAELLDADGAGVRVTGRGLLTADPAVLVLASVRAEVMAWAGPWPYEERWWDPRLARRRARLQVVTTAGAAHLLVLEGGGWSVECTYD